MVRRALVILSCLGSLVACAHSQQAGGFGKAEPSGFLKDYSMLHPAKDETEATLVYFVTDRNKFKSYDKALLEPVQVWRGGGKYAWKPLHRWEDVEQAMDYWAKKFRWRGCMIRGDAGCTKPEE
ncbi:DUF3313 family protein [Nitrospira sp. Nam80]